MAVWGCPAGRIRVACSIYDLDFFARLLRISVVGRVLVVGKKLYVRSLVAAHSSCNDRRLRHAGHSERFSSSASITHVPCAGLTLALTLPVSHSRHLPLKHPQHTPHDVWHAVIAVHHIQNPCSQYSHSRPRYSVSAPQWKHGSFGWPVGDSLSGRDIAASRSTAAHLAALAGVLFLARHSFLFPSCITSLRTLFFWARWRLSVLLRSSSVASSAASSAADIGTYICVLWFI